MPDMYYTVLLSSYSSARLTPRIVPECAMLRNRTGSEVRA